MREIREILILWILTMVRVWIPYLHYNHLAGAVWVMASLFYLLSVQYARWKSIKALPATESSLAKEGGIRWDTFFPCLRVVSPFLVVFIFLIVVIYISEGQPTLCRNLPLRYLLYFLWALFQQYLLQGFIVVRLRSFGKSRVWTAFLTGLIFASVHLPNPGLTVATFIGGWILSYAFLIYPNLFSVAIAHSLIAVSMKCFLPKTILANMYVGIYYLYPPP